MLSERFQTTLPSVSITSDKLGIKHVRENVTCGLICLTSVEKQDSDICCLQEMQIKLFQFQAYL